MIDYLYPLRLQWYRNADVFTDLSDEVNDKAWSYRDANFAEVIVAVDPDPAQNQEMIAWANRTLNRGRERGRIVMMVTFMARGGKRQ